MGPTAARLNVAVDVAGLAPCSIQLTPWPASAQILATCPCLRLLPQTCGSCRPSVAAPTPLPPCPCSLVTSKTYEAEMFKRAGRKLGLSQAVFESGGVSKRFDASSALADEDGGAYRCSLQCCLAACDGRSSVV